MITKYFLGDVPLFQGLKPRQLDKLAKRMREREYEEGETIVEQGKDGIGLYVIMDGNAKVILTHADGTSSEIDQLGEADFFGEMSLLDDAPRTATVTAANNMRCAVLSKLDLMDELEDDPQIAVEMLRALSKRFRRLMMRV